MSALEKIFKKVNDKFEHGVGDQPIMYRKLDLTYNYDEDEEPILFI